MSVNNDIYKHFNINNDNSNNIISNNIFNLKNDLKSRDKHKLELENGKVIEFVSSIIK